MRKKSYIWIAVINQAGFKYRKGRGFDMTFKEFTKWCNERACDGCWGMKEAIQCMEIGTLIAKQRFWKREKIWKDYCDEVGIVEKIVEPTSRKIAEVYGAN